MARTAVLDALHARAVRHVPGARMPSPLDDGQVRHLVRRATWGATPELLAAVRADPQGWLERQLAPSGLADPVADAAVARLPYYGQGITQVRTEARAAKREGHWDAMWQTGQATVARQVWSSRQLLEVLVDLWSNRLNATCPSSDVWDNRHDYDKVVRARALGRFEDLLLATARHPAMLRYLDAASSTKQAPNENYAREVMELHTVGVGAGYGEEGVRAAARVLTGMVVDDATGLYRFDPARHDTSAATVLGWSTPAHAPADGEAVGTSLLRYLANHPSTARGVARALAVRFVSDDPPAALVDRLAAAYTAAGTEVVPVLRALFAAPEFWASAGQKTRRPLEGFVAAVRAVGSQPGPAGLGGVDDLYWQLDSIGHRPLAWSAPNGYPDVAAAWASAGSTLQRWNQTTAVAQGWWPTKLVRPASQTLIPSPTPTTIGALVDALVVRLLGRGPTPVEHAALVAFTGRPAGDRLRSDDEWLGWHMPTLVHTILNGPGHMER